MMRHIQFTLAFFFGVGGSVATGQSAEFSRVSYQDKRLVTDLGVGLWAWPLPMDYDQDGDMDLVVSCPDVPFRGVYFFENKSGGEFPVFEAPVRVGEYIRNPQISYVKGAPRVIDRGYELVDFRSGANSYRRLIFPPDSLMTDFKKKPRFTQYTYVDYDGDGDQDVVVGVDDWTQYGWDNAFDKNGNWTNGPLHGYVYLFENVNGGYTNRGRVKAGGEILDVYGAPSPQFADFDRDGDLDIICGEFLDSFTYFENTGTRTTPEYAKGKKLRNASGIIRMDLEMIIPVAVDWNGDGHTDLVVGDEDGRVAYVKNTGRMEDGAPVFDSPRYFQQKAGFIKFGALPTPFSVDWDDDGDQDIVIGNSAGYIGFIENRGGKGVPDFAPPRYLEADGKVIRIQAGQNGSIQGPAEAKWGYTTLSVADWDGDGLKDLIVNSIWGKVQWYKNTGTKGAPRLASAAPVQVDWKGPAPKPAWNWWVPGPAELSTQWRTTPFAVDWNKDGLTDLVMLDHEGYLAFFERFKKGSEHPLRPGNRIFCLEDGTPLRLNQKNAGGSGRRKFTLMDWDRDGDLDLVIDGKNAEWYEQVGKKGGKVTFLHRGDVSALKLAGHDTSPTPVDWDGEGAPDLLLGAEDGLLYYLKR
ncbi:VCBS repeat-containing protein [Ravibacter arvi]|uniref:VCBS repeat-containing protein n=1 Tax=Ravibacter arvi TaxID=2051041 RepID=A0ABP8LZ96_9BACT